MTVNAFSYAKSFYVYLEGIKTNFTAINITSSRNTPASASISFPYKKSANRIRPNTLCEIFFVDENDEMRLLFRGELIEKTKQRDSHSARLEMRFLSVSANFDRTRIAFANDIDGSGFVNYNRLLFRAALYPFLLGITGGTNNINTGDATTAAATLSNSPGGVGSIVATAFRNAFFGKDFSFDLVRAYKNMFEAYRLNLNDSFQRNLMVKGATSRYFTLADARFRLIDGIVGGADPELASIYFGRDSTEVARFVDSLSMDALGADTLLNMVRIVSYKAYHSFCDFIAPTAIGTFLNGSTTQTNVIPTLLIMPDLKHADPPSCNVFLPSTFQSVSHSISSKRPTRIVYFQNPTIKAADPDNIDDLYGIVGVLPKSVKDKMFKGNTVQWNDSCSQEETEIGVNPELVDPSYPYIAATAKDIATWYEKILPIRFDNSRHEVNSCDIEMSFNPYPVVGLPGAVIDTEMGIGRGRVESISHSITPTSSHTRIHIGACHFSDDAIDFDIPDISIPESAKKDNTQANLGSSLFNPGNPDDFYSSFIGVNSITKFESGGINLKSDSPNESIKKAMTLIQESTSVEGGLLVAKKINQRNIATVQDVAKFYGVSDSSAENFNPAISRALPYTQPYITLATGANTINKFGTSVNLRIVVPEGVGRNFLEVTGKTLPNVTVNILSNGNVLSSVKSDASGNFTALVGQSDKNQKVDVSVDTGSATLKPISVKIVDRSDTSNPENTAINEDFYFIDRQSAADAFSLDIEKG